MKTDNTINIINKISNSLKELKECDLQSIPVKKAISEMLNDKFLTNLLINSYEMGESFWMFPDKFVPINDIGHERIKNLYGRFAIMYLVKNLPVFNQAYDVLTEGKHFSHENVFGEMHGDKYLWIEKHDKMKILVFKEQSHSFIYIKDGASFYIRSLEHGKEEKMIEKLRKINFKKGKLPIFMYGDGRDKNHILSCNMLIENSEIKADGNTSEMTELINAFKEISNRSITDNANYHTIHAIEEIGEWKYYLDNQDELE